MAALTTAQINARLASLYQIRDSGVLLVRHGDTSTQMRSMDDVLRAINILEGQLATVTGNPKRSRVSYVRQNSKGYGCDDAPPPGGRFE